MSETQSNFPLWGVKALHRKTPEKFPIFLSKIFSFSTWSKTSKIRIIHFWTLQSKQFNSVKIFPALLLLLLLDFWFVHFTIIHFKWNLLDFPQKFNFNTAYDPSGKPIQHWGKKVKEAERAFKYIILLKHHHHLRECFCSQLVEKLAIDSRKQMQLGIQWRIPLVQVFFVVFLFTISSLHVYERRNYKITIMKLLTVRIRKNLR